MFVEQSHFLPIKIMKTIESESWTRTHAHRNPHPAGSNSLIEGDVSQKIQIKLHLKKKN